MDSSSSVSVRWVLSELEEETKMVGRWGGWGKTVSVMIVFPALCPEHSLQRRGLKNKRPVVQAFGLKHGGVVALHPGQPGVLHCSHGD